jgi:hypothetical protein
MRGTAAFLAVAVAIGSGCHSSDWMMDRALGKSKTWSAEKAWRSHRWMFIDVPCESSFKAGFKAGYRFACGGYDSCEPPVPNRYYRINGLTADDRQAAQAWSDGFTHGTLAAQQESMSAPSELDAAAAQPPEGTPDVRYVNPPANGFDPFGGVPTQMPPGNFAPGSFVPGDAASENSPMQMAPQISPNGNYEGTPYTAPPAPPAEPSGPSSFGPPPIELGPPPPPEAPSGRRAGIDGLRNMVPPEPTAAPGTTIAPAPPAIFGNRGRIAQPNDWQMPIMRD